MCYKRMMPVHHEKALLSRYGIAWGVIHCVILVGCAGVMLPSHPLLEAARKGDDKTIAALIASGVDVNTTEDGMTALTYAASQGHELTVRLLLENKANANAKTKEGFTPLMLASATLWERVGIVEALLENGAEVNAKADNGATALMFASIKGYSGIVGKLLDHGANANARTTDGKTALWAAKQTNHKEVIAILSTAGARE